MPVIHVPWILYNDLTARGPDAGRQVPLRLRYCYFYLHADGRRRDSTNRFTPTRSTDLTIPALCPGSPQTRPAGE